jgi:chemotaxis protein methyltransferase CheR
MSDSTALVETGRVPHSPERISASDFTRLAKLVYETCGIRLNASKKLMVETRLRKRVHDTGARTMSEYWKLLSRKGACEQELVRFIDAITTNKTDFFREPRHFEYLVEQVLPPLSAHLKAHKRPLKVWSAGCSTGKEPYTLAMVLSEAQRRGVINEFCILGTDISTEVLKQASRAIYQESDIEPIPEALRKKYLLKSRNEGSRTFRMVPEIRQVVDLQRLNLMDASYRFDKPFDVIFCRNVMIYFDRPTQQAVVNRFHACLRPGGYLFTGHSETLNGLATQLMNAAPTIYRRGTGA